MKTIQMYVLNQGLLEMWSEEASCLVLVLDFAVMHIEGDLFVCLVVTENRWL